MILFSLGKGIQRELFAYLMGVEFEFDSLFIIVWLLHKLNWFCMVSLYKLFVVI